MQRGLSGDFATMPLKDLVVYLGNKRVSGELILTRGRLKKTALIRDGHVLSASSNDPREYLGQFLINMGHLTEEQFEKAYQTQRETSIFLGKILVMTNQVSELIVRNALSLKVRETLLEPFNWPEAEGAFSFDPTRSAEPPDGLDLQLDLVDIHREGDFRDTAWNAIRSVFTTGKMKLQVNESRLAETPKPGSLDERLVALIKQGQTIDDMVLSLHATDFFMYQRLYALYRLEAVTPASVLPDDDEPIVGVEIADDVTPGDLSRNIEMLMAQGQHVEAESFARAAAERFPTPELSSLLKRSEAALLVQLRRELIDNKAIPSLKVSPGTLNGLKITAPERYLLSRIDGHKTVTAIVTVSPLQELQALRLFRRFIDAELVTIRVS